MKISSLKTLVARIAAVVAIFTILCGARVLAQNTQPAVILTNSNAAVTLSTSIDNYEVLAGTLINGAASNGAINGASTATAPWYFKNSGTIIGVNSGMYFGYDANITNMATGLISGTANSTSQGGIYFASTGAGYIENSGTIIGGLKGINFGNTARLNTVINYAGGVIKNALNGTTSGAVYAANNNTVSLTNAGFIWGAYRGLQLGGASTVLNTGTIWGDSGTAIMFAATAVTASSTLTLGTGSEIKGDIVSATSALNTIVLIGSGSDKNNFIGNSSDATKGFTALIMSGTDWLLTGTVQLSGTQPATLNVTSGRLMLAGNTVFSSTYGAVSIAIGGTLQLGNNSTTGAIANATAGAAPAISNNGVFVASHSDNISLSNIISGAGAIVQAGAGVLSLTGNNTFTGGVRVDSGTLAVANDTGLGAISGALTLNGGAVRYDATITSARSLILSANGLFDTNGNSVTLSGSITGTGNLTKTGAGLFQLTGINTSVGATTITGGTLQGNIGTGLLTVNSGATYKVAAGTIDAVIGNIAGAGTVDLNSANLVFNVVTGTQAYGFAGTLQNGNNLRKTGTGMLDLGAHSFAGELSATGTTIVENGVLAFNAPSQIGPNVLLGSATSIGILQTDFSTWTQNITLTGSGGGLSVTSGTKAIAITISGVGDFVKTGSGGLDITGATMAQTGGNTQIQQGTLITAITGLKGDTTIATNATLTLNQAASSSTYSGTITGGGSLVKNGAGEAILTGANSYTGDTTVNSGTLTGNIGLGTLTVNANATYKVASGVADFSLSGIHGSGTVNLNTANLNFNVTTGTSVFNFTGVLTGGNQLIKTGAGTIELQTAAALTNGVAVKEGTLKLADQSFVNSPVALGDTTTIGMIEYTGATAWNKNIVLTGLGGGFTVNTGTQALATTATISGAGDFIKSGTGALDITTAVMNNTGNTQIQAGTLITAIAGLKGNTTIASSATLALSQAALTSGTCAGTITGGGSFVKNGAGETVLTGVNTYAGDTTVNAGTLTGNIGLGTLTVNANATYKVANGVNNFSLAGILGTGTVNLNAANLNFNVATGTSVFNFTGALTGGNQLIKTGAGTIELQTAAALTNGVAVKEGTLKLADQSFVNSPVALGDTTTIGMIEYTGATAWNKNIALTGLGGGFTVNTGTQALATTATISGAGDFIKSGTSALDITTAVMNNTGNTKVQDGTLIANTASLKGDTTLVAVTAILDIKQTAVTSTYAGVISGAGSLVKDGAGETVLTGANTYAGNTTINAGSLTGNIGLGTLTVNANATYKVADGVNNFSLAGILGTGTINLNTANLNFNVATGTSVFNFTGALTGGNQLIKTGTGTLDLQTAAALTNGVAVKEGTLKLANQNYINSPVALGDTTSTGMIEYTNNAVAWNKNITLTGLGGGFTVDTGTQSLATTATISGAGNFIKSGTGALDITTAVMNNTGNTKIQDGTLIANTTSLKGDTTLVAATAILDINQTADTGTYAGVISGVGSLIKDGAGESVLTGANAYTGNTTINAGTLSGNIGTGTLTVNANATYKVAGGITDFSLTGILGTGTVNLNTANLTLNVASGTSIFNFIGALTGGNQLIKTGAGTLDLQAAAALANGVAVQNGTLKLADQSYINAPIVLGGTTTTGLILYTGTDAWAKNIALTGSGGGFNITTSNTLALAPAVTITGTGNFIKTGSGTLDTTAVTASYTGRTIVQNGRLIANATSIYGSATLAAGTTLEFSQAINGLYSGNISGAGSLVKSNSGTLALTGSNTQTGGITILGGALSGNTAALQGNITTSASTAVIFNQSADGTYSAAITGAGTLVKEGSGKLILTGANKQTGGTRINSGALQISATNVTGNIENNATLIFEQATAGTYAGIITGAGQVQKSGGGTLTLSGANTYSGATLITQGTLRASAANRLSPNSQYVIFGNLATLDLGLGDQTIAGLVNTGTILITATVNPSAGAIVAANRLIVNGDAGGNGKILVHIAETVSATTGISDRTIIKITGANLSNYTGELDKRYVNGAYDWTVTPGADGQSYILTAGQVSPEIPAAASLPALAEFMAKAGMDTLAQRLGDMRDDPTHDAGLWFRGIYREDTLNGSLLDGTKLTTYGGQAGFASTYNDVFSSRGRAALGVLLTMVQTNTHDKTTADLDGDTKEVGVFATYQTGGWYSDLMLNIAHNRYSVKMRDGSDAVNFTGWGPTAQLETGWQLNSHRLGVFEPQLQVTYQYCQIGETSDAYKRNYKLDSAEMFNAYAGMRWHKIYTLGQTGAFIPALRMRYGYEFLGDTRIHVEGEHFTNKISGSQYSVDGGFSWWFSRSTGIYANCEYASGKAVKSVAATAGLRLSW